jgi:hypothetical protein
MRSERLDPSHQHVEQSFTRRLFRHVGVGLGEYLVIDLLHMGRENGEGGGELVTQLRERHSGAAGNLSTADLLEWFFGQQRHESGDDPLTVGTGGGRLGCLARLLRLAKLLRLPGMSRGRTSG